MSSHACVEVNPSCNHFTKEQRLKPFDSNARARNPRVYFVLAGAKPRFVTKKGPQKSGIPCSEQRIAMSSHACVEVNPSCNFLQKKIASNPTIATHRHVISCRARNPRFYFIHTGTKSRFLTKNGHRK
jgi:hypothetical protein